MSTSSPSNQAIQAPLKGVVQDEKRVQTLHKYNVLDTESEPAFDRIAQLAAHLFDAPMALVNFVDADRQWFKSSIGVEEKETGLDVSFCVYTVEKGDVFVVEDLTEDERFASNPYVTDQGIQFYAGAPLINPDGHRLGTVCVFDTEPQSPSEDVLDRLADLAAMVVDELELRRERMEHEQSQELLRHAQELAKVGGWAYDPEADSLRWTDETYRIHECPPDAEIDVASAVEFYAPEDRPVIESRFETLLEEGGRYDLELSIETAAGNWRRVRTIGEAQREDGETTQISGAIQDVTEQHQARRLMQVQTAFFEWIATGAPIDAVLDEIAQFTEEELSADAVSILRLDDNRLYHAAGPSLPDEYVEAIDGIEIGPGVGTCGTAAYQEQEVVTQDIQEDERWDEFRAAAEQSGYRSCYSQAIQGSDGTIYGTFAIYRGETGVPNPAQRQMVKRMSHVASVALEREQHERALLESENRWQRLVDNHPGPIHVSIDRKYAYANQATAELLGVGSVDDLIGRDMSDFVHPDERDLLHDRKERVYEDRDEVELIETRIQRPDGAVRTVLVRSVPIQYEGQKAAQTMMWDVTERRQAELELQRSEEKFRTVVENARPVTFMIDRDGTFLLSEGTDLQALGLEPGEVVGESVFDVYANTPGIIQGIRRALDGEYVDNEVEIDGRIFDNWFSPFYDEDGDVAGVIGMAADITEEKEAQMELLKQKEMLQTLFDNVPVMITLLNEGEVELVNNHVESVLGWSEEEMTSDMDLLARCYPDSEQRERVLEYTEEAPDEWRDFRPQRKDGDRLDTTWKNVHLPDGRTLGIGVDISDRKARERELRDSNQRLRLALEAADAGTFEYDLETDRVLWDERSLNLYGMNLDVREQDPDLVGEIILEEDLDQLEDVFNRAVEEGEMRYDVSYRIRRADDGELRHIHSHGIVLPDEEGEAERVIGINRDVTERKERQKQLRLLETAVEQSPATVLVTEADPLDEPGPKTVYANPTFERMTGYDRDDIIGQSPRMLQGPDTDPDALSRIRTALENEESVREVVRNYTNDGTPYWNDLFIAPVRDEEGTVTHYVSIQQDVTERRRRKQTLERQNDLFAKAQDIANVGAWEYDHQSGEAILTDEAFRIHGLDPGDGITPEETIRLFHADDQPKLRAAFERALEQGESYDLELRLTTEDGERRWIRTRGEPQQEHGEVVRIRGTIQDITSRKEREQELRRSREQLSMAVEGGNIGTWNWDTETDEVIFNRRWAEMLGYSREELDFRFSTWEELVHPEDLPRATAVLERYIAGEADTYAPEIRMRTKSGEWKWIQTIGKVVERDEEGVVTRAAGIHLDIDDRKRAEQALRDANSRYETLIEHFPDGGVFLFDDNLRYTIAGGQGLEAVGLSASDFEGKAPKDIFPAEIAEEQADYYRQALEGKKNGFEQTFQGQDYHVQTLPVRDDEGDVIAGMAVSQDITEQKETRQKLERYREYTDRLLNAVDDLFFAIDEDAQMRRWNDRIIEVTGYTQEEIEGMTAFDFVPESEHERLSSTIAESFSEGSVQIKLPLLKADGTTVLYEFVGNLVEHPEGDLQLVGIGRDITERQRRKRKLERQNDLFSMAQTLARVGAWEYDVGTGESIVTDEVKRIHGLSPEEELAPERSISFYHSNDQESIRDAFSRAVEKGEPYDLELRLITDHGEPRWIRTQGKPQREDGEVVRVRGTIQDVTKRVQRREALEDAKEAAEEADRIKSALLSNMNHEFRTPLTSILTFSELIRDNPDAADRFIERILGGGKRLLYTLNTVMDFAELEGDGQSVTPQRLRLEETARSVVNNFRERARQEDIDLSVDIGDEVRSVRLDPYLVERILTHLLHNAVKFTDEGRVTVSVRMGDVARLCVADTGVGIDPDFLPHVFDEFAQASSGYDRTHEGNGLGLTVVKRMVDRMGGDTTIESTPGEGTTVTVQLPFER